MFCCACAPTEPQNTDGATFVGSTPSGVDVSTGQTGSPNTTVAEAGTVSPTFALAPIVQDQDVQHLPPLNLVSLASPKLCADIANANPNVGVVLGLWYCNGVSGAQGWALRNGVLQSAGPFCLAVGAGETAAPGAHPTLQACDSAHSLAWIWSEGHVQISGTQVCLALSAATAASNLTLAACDPAASLQAWGLATNDGNRLMGAAVRSGNGNVCLQAQAPGNGINAATFAAACNGVGAQQWVWERGALRALGRCLTVNNGDRASVTLADCLVDPLQDWQLIAGKIVNVGTGTCLANISGVGGTPVLQMQACSGTDSQIWALGSP